MFDSKENYNHDYDKNSSPFAVDMDQINNNQQVELMIKSLIVDGFCILTNNHVNNHNSESEFKFKCVNTKKKNGKHPLNIISDCVDLNNYPMNKSENFDLQQYNQFVKIKNPSNVNNEDCEKSNRIAYLFNDCSKLLNDEIIPRISLKLTYKYTAFDNYTVTNSYSFLDGFQTNTENIFIESFSFLTIYKFKSNSKLKIFTKTAPAYPITYFNNSDNDFYLLSVGKIFEILTKGLFFNSILKIDSDNPSNDYFVLSKYLDFCYSFGEYLQMYDSVCQNTEYSDATYRCDSLLNKRLFTINRSTINQLREKPFRIHGYTKSDIDYLKMREDFILVDFNIETDLYLVCFNLNEKIGKYLCYDLVMKNDHELLTNPDSEIIQKLNSFLAYKLKKFTNYFEKLSKILMNLDNLLFIYFMNHVNFPSLNNFLVKLSNVLKFNVTSFDIFTIKVIYPDSYKFFPNKNKNVKTTDTFGEDYDFLVGFNEQHLNLKTFKDQRKLLFEKLLNEFKYEYFIGYDNSELLVRYNKAEIFKFLQNINDLTIKLNSRMDIFIADTNYQKLSDVKICDFSNASDNLLKKNKKLLINKITEKNKSSRVNKSSTVKMEKLSLIERIKLKQYNNAKTLKVLEKSTCKTNFKELYNVVFTILSNLNNTSVFTSIPISSLVDTICRSIANNHTMAVSNDTILNVLYHFNTILPDDLFQIVNLSGIALGSIIVKFNFYNKRDEVLHYINK